MAIEWPCAVSVDADADAAAGRMVEVPVVACPGCEEELGPWSGYWRFVWEAGRCVRVFVPSGRCRACGATHALLPGFVVRNRLDVFETIGTLPEVVESGPGGVRSAAVAALVPHTTARGWVRAFAACARRLTVRFCALAIKLGGVRHHGGGRPTRRSRLGMRSPSRFGQVGQARHQPHSRWCSDRHPDGPCTAIVGRRRIDHALIIGTAPTHVDHYRDRRQLLDGLAEAIELLTAAGCRRIWLNGSFVTAKEEPGDFDACSDTDGIDLDVLDPVLIDFSHGRAGQKRRLGGELLPDVVEADSGLSFSEFFRHDRDGGRKGIVVLMIGAEP